jgi:CheY-like chemotaxis protein/prolyl-tRNA editing enzyme YbaK/EbsC (Cys-tRNA(Pro) deacylase)
MAVPHWFRRILNHYDVPFEEIPHPPTYTASELAQTLHVTGHRVAKTVFFAGDRHPIAVVLPANTPVDPARVGAVLGGGKIRFASETEIAGWFKGCEPGAVPPLKLRGDERILMDRSLAHFGTMVFPAGSLGLAVSVKFRDWYRMVRPGIGRFAQAANGHLAKEAPAPTVLVVEDEADTNQLFCRLLQQEGYACHGAHDGGRALALATEVHPSAILLDLMLPDMNGFEVYEQLRRSGPLKRTPLVVVTALDDANSRERGRQLGADAYLTKPFAPQALVRELHEVLADAD